MTMLKQFWSLTWRFTLTSIAFAFCFIIGSLFVANDAHTSATGTEVSSTASQGEGGEVFVLVLLIQAVIFSVYVKQSTWTGWRLIISFFLLYFSFTTLLPQMDTWVFEGAFSQGLAQKIILMGLTTAVLFSPLIILIWGKLNGTVQRKSRTVPWLWLVGLFPLFYIVVYFLFGYYVAWQEEELRVFYNKDPAILPFLQHMTNLVHNDWILFPFQYLRGWIWVALAWLIIISSSGNPWRHGLLVAALMTTPVVLLLLPNPFMPEVVRMAHFWETLYSNLLFGFVTGYGLSSLGRK